MADIIQLHPRMAAAKGPAEQIYLHMALEHLSGLDTQTFRYVQVDFQKSHWPDIPDYFRVRMAFLPRPTGYDINDTIELRLMSCHFDGDDARSGSSIVGVHYGLHVLDRTPDALASVEPDGDMPEGAA